MAQELKLIKQGAEAKIYSLTYLGRPAIIKERFQKSYRHIELDTTITKDRIKNEARSIVRARYAGVRTPCLYLVDFDRRRIYMEHFVTNITVKDYIINIITKQKLEDEDGSKHTLEGLAKMIGETVRKLHVHNIIHGDLTTSNMLLIPKTPTEVVDDGTWKNIDNLELVMIDFGLSYTDSSTEDKGVDLYVLERALISTHNDYPDIFNDVLEAYKNYSKENVRETISKFEEVRARGRKRTMVG